MSRQRVRIMEDPSSRYQSELNFKLSRNLLLKVKMIAELIRDYMKIRKKIFLF